jgi:ribosome-associated translation inhibitor RaiA
VVIVTENAAAPIELVKRGEIDDVAVAYALKRVGAVMEQIGAPILLVRVRLTRDNDPRRLRPATAQATFDLNGELIRGQVAADTMTEAIDLLADRLRDQIRHRAERRRARRATGRVARPGEWRHGDMREARPLFVDRPADEREIVHHKSFAIDPATPDEAAADMEQLDHGFWLFHDLASDADAVIERAPGDGYRLQRARPATAEAGPIAIDLTLVDHEPPKMSLDDAVLQLEDGGQPFVFYIDADTDRGTVIYRRYDGHYGVLTPERP